MSSLPGSYANFPTGNLELEGFPLLSASASTLGGLQNILTLDAKIKLEGFGETGLQTKYGPQGRAYDTDVTLSSGARASLAGVNIDIGSFELVGDTVKFAIGGNDFVYRRNELNTEFRDLLVQSLDASDQSIEAAINILDAIMQAAEDVDTIGDAIVPDRTETVEFPAKFESVGGNPFEEFELSTVGGYNLVSLQYAGLFTDFFRTPEEESPSSVVNGFAGYLAEAGITQPTVADATFYLEEFAFSPKVNSVADTTPIFRISSTVNEEDYQFIETSSPSVGPLKILINADDQDNVLMVVPGSSVGGDIDGMGGDDYIVGAELG